jgi:hypothetical protein
MKRAVCDLLRVQSVALAFLPQRLVAIGRQRHNRPKAASAWSYSDNLKADLRARLLQSRRPACAQEPLQRAKV